MTNVIKDSFDSDLPKFVVGWFSSTCFETGLRAVTLTHVNLRFDSSNERRRGTLLSTSYRQSSFFSSYLLIRIKFYIFIYDLNLVEQLFLIYDIFSLIPVYVCYIRST